MVSWRSSRAGFGSPVGVSSRAASISPATTRALDQQATDDRQPDAGRAARDQRHLTDETAGHRRLLAGAALPDPVRPPSMTNCVPVTLPDRSEHRYMTMLATSSGVE